MGHEIPQRDARLPGGKQPPKPKSDLIEEAIREAMDRGDFDNLPGKGKPLQLENAADEGFLARKILKDAGYVPPWVELEQEIEKDRAAAAAKVQRFRERYTKARRKIADSPHRIVELAALLDRERSKAREEYRTLLSTLANKVFRFNLIVPVKDRQIMGINVERALGEFDLEFRDMP